MINYLKKLLVQTKIETGRTGIGIETEIIDSSYGSKFGPCQFNFASSFYHIKIRNFRTEINSFL